MEYKSKARKPLYKKKAPLRVKVVSRPRYKSSISANPSVFKDNLTVKLNYYEQAELTAPVGGALVNYVFSANGCYDPNITSTGHQPMGFDQLMPMYDHYTVKASKITVHVFNNSTNSPVNFALSTSDSSTGLSAPGQLIENGKVDYSQLSSRTGSRSVKDMQRYVNISKFMGRPGILTEDDFRGSISANPLEQVYHVLSAWLQDPGAAEAALLTFDVLIEYYLTFTEPRKLSQS